MGLSWTEIVAVVSVSVEGLIVAVLWIIYGTTDYGKKRKYFKTAKSRLERNPEKPMLEALIGKSAYDDYIDSVGPEALDEPRKLRTRYPPNIYHIHNAVTSKLHAT